MREYATPRLSPAGGRAHLTDDVVRQAEEHPERALFARRRETGRGTGPHTRRDSDPDRGPGTGPGTGWEDVGAARFRDEVVRLARGLVATGVGPGDRVGLVCRTRYEWTLVDYAVWWCGAVTVPLYVSAPAEQVGWVLADAEVRTVVVETTWLRERVEEVAPGLERCWVVDDGDLEVLAGRAGEVDAAEVERRRTDPGRTDLATIIYTAGTTGPPKACALTHAHLDAGLTGALDALPDLFDGGDASTVLFLPLAHVLARFVQVGCVRSGARLAHTGGLADLPADLATLRPTFLLAVPRVFERLFTTASQQATADGRGTLFERAADTAIAWSRARERGRVPVALRARHAGYGRLVYPRLREALGGCRWVISGGAPLGDRLAHFYRGIGITVLEGWGLTETAGPVCVNVPGALKIGTVGRPLPGTAVRVAEDGELLVRGGQVFAGYLAPRGGTDAGDGRADGRGGDRTDGRTGDRGGGSDEGAPVVEPDGWLHTGDVGEVDDEGFVRVTGRRQEILVTAGGKSVAPAVLEERVRAHPLVAHCLVVGDRRPFVAALVALDRETLVPWAVARGVPVDDPEALAQEPVVRAEVAAAVQAANRRVSQAEAVRRFRVVGREWSEESGDLTPSLKLRRSEVTRRHREEIEDLYRD